MQDRNIIDYEERDGEVNLVPQQKQESNEYFIIHARRSTHLRGVDKIVPVQINYIECDENVFRSEDKSDDKNKQLHPYRSSPVHLLTFEHEEMSNRYVLGPLCRFNAAVLETSIQYRRTAAGNNRTNPLTPLCVACHASREQSLLKNEHS